MFMLYFLITYEKRFNEYPGLPGVQGKIDAHD